VSGERTADSQKSKEIDKKQPEVTKRQRQIKRRNREKTAALSPATVRSGKGIMG
jgi:hypothetical protein